MASGQQGELINFLKSFERFAENAVLVVQDEDDKIPGRIALSKSDIVEFLRSAR